MSRGHVGFYGMEHAIPETDSGADGIASGCFCLCLPHRIAAAKARSATTWLSGPWDSSSIWM